MKNRAQLLLAAAPLLLAGCTRGRTADTEAPRGIAVRTATVEKRDLPEHIVLTGTLKPRAQVQVVAEVPARLLRVLRDEGARVGKGEVLAVLDDTDYRLGAATTLDVLDAQAALTQAEFTRIEALHAHANARAGLRYVMGQDPLADRGTP